MELNCPICKVPMKAYHGLFEKDMYCPNENCGKTKTVTYEEKHAKVTINGEAVDGLDLDASTQELAKAINEALQKAFADYLNSTTPNTSVDLDKIICTGLKEIK